MSMKMAKGMSFNWPWGLNRSPYETEPLYPFTGHNTGSPDAPVMLTGRWTSAFGRPTIATCPDLNGHLS